MAAAAAGDCRPQRASGTAHLRGYDCPSAATGSVAAAAAAAARRQQRGLSSGRDSSQGFFDRQWWLQLWGSDQQLQQQQQQARAAASFWFDLEGLLLLGEGSTGDAGAKLRGVVTELADHRAWNRHW